MSRISRRVRLFCLSFRHFIFPVLPTRIKDGHHTVIAEKVLCRNILHTSFKAMIKAGDLIPRAEIPVQIEAADCRIVKRAALRSNNARKQD